jgi:diguanylate cyclase (GGDEF)-like protein
VSLATAAVVSFVIGVAIGTLAVRRVYATQFARRRSRMLHDAEALARTDPLTGLRNRRAVFEQAALAVEQARRYARPLSVVLLDVDRLGAINQRWGHAAGDRVLSAVAAQITRSARATDLAGRIGGDEFAIVLPETSAADAAVQAARLRGDIVELLLRGGHPDLVATCSFGVSERRAGDTVDTLMSRADAALRDAKAHGRNRVTEARAHVGTF